MTISSMRGPRRCGLLTRHWPESATYRIGIGCQPLRAGDGHSYPSTGRLGHAEGMESVATTHLTRSRELHLASRWEEACVESVSYTHLRAHETDSYLVCRLLL